MTPQCPHCGEWSEAHEQRDQWFLGTPFTVMVCPKLIGWRLVENRSSDSWKPSPP